MTNLIPPAAKKQITKLYWLRVCSLWMLAWSGALLIGVLLMYPTHVLITGTSSVYQASAANVSERTEIYDSMVADLNRSNQEAIRVVRGAQQTKLSELLADIWSVNGRGATVSEVNMVRSEVGIGPIRLVGEAEDRQALASFRDRIETLEYVENVDLPIENLAQNQDIIFNITVNVNTSDS